MYCDIVYVVSPSGHRQSYVELLSSELGMMPVIGAMSPSRFLALLRAERLLLATIDDHIVSFAILAFLRWILRRRTVGLFLRFRATVYGASAIRSLKRFLFRGLKKLDSVSIVSILPFSVDPRFAEVATDGVYDPQMWDMHNGRTIKELAFNEFYDFVQAEARGRRVIGLPGSLSRIKGFGLMTEMMTSNAEVFDDILFVAAGRVDKELRAQAVAFSANGGLLVDRRISDDELQGLYAACDAIWCCYSADYDQASGIFGRAIQFGRTPIVRGGSLIEKVAEDLGISAISIDINDPQRLVMQLKESGNINRDQSNLSSRIGTIRTSFFDIIGARLSGKPHRSH